VEFVEYANSAGMEGNIAMFPWGWKHVRGTAAEIGKSCGDW